MPKLWLTLSFNANDNVEYSITWLVTSTHLNENIDIFAVTPQSLCIAESNKVTLCKNDRGSGR